MHDWNALYFIIIAVMGIFPGHLLHEFSHWFVGKISGSQPKPMWKEVFGRKVWVTGIDHNALDDVSDRVIQVSGFVPIFWLLVALLIGILVWISPSILNFLPIEAQILVISTPFAASVKMTESDVTAFLNPEKYRKRSRCDNLSRRWGWQILGERAFALIR